MFLKGWNVLVEIKQSLNSQLDLCTKLKINIQVLTNPNAKRMFTDKLEDTAWCSFQKLVIVKNSFQKILLANSFWYDWGQSVSWLSANSWWPVGYLLVTCQWVKLKWLQTFTCLLFLNSGLSILLWLLSTVLALASDTCPNWLCFIYPPFWKVFLVQTYMKYLLLTIVLQCIIGQLENYFLALLFVAPEWLNPKPTLCKNKDMRNGY